MFIIAMHVIVRLDPVRLDPVRLDSAWLGLAVYGASGLAWPARPCRLGPSDPAYRAFMEVPLLRRALKKPQRAEMRAALAKHKPDTEMAFSAIGRAFAALVMAPYMFNTAYYYLKCIVFECFMWCAYVVVRPDNMCIYIYI